MPLKFSLRDTIRALDGFHVAAFIVRMGFRAILYYNSDKKPIGKHLGTSTTAKAPCMLNLAKQQHKSCRFTPDAAPSPGSVMTEYLKSANGAYKHCPLPQWRCPGEGGAIVQSQLALDEIPRVAWAKLGFRDFGSPSSLQCRSLLG